MTLDFKEAICYIRNTINSNIHIIDININT